MINLLYNKGLLTWIVYSILFLIVFIIINKDKEHFYYMPWNMSTRYYPSYDIRGDPRVNYPIFYLSPYNYGVDGKYYINR